MGVLICLDPGHGGSDHGATGLSLLEKDICLEMAYRIAKNLLTYEGIRVTMTRSFDIQRTSKDRIEWANQKQADFYLSLHTNASYHSQDSGFSSYVSVFAGSKTRRIQRWLHNQIAFFLRQVEVFDYGKKNDTESLTGSLETLRHVQMPAVALGLLFITNHKEHYLLTDEQFIDQYARCIAQSIAMNFHCSTKKCENTDIQVVADRL